MSNYWLCDVMEGRLQSAEEELGDVSTVIESIKICLAHTKVSND
jgi:hypothetical protein